MRTPLPPTITCPSDLSTPLHQQTKREGRVAMMTGRGDERGWGDHFNGNPPLGL